MRDTIEMALEAGFWQEHTNTYMCNTDDIKAFEAFVRADEREACANTCDSTYYQYIGPQFGEVRHGIAACAAAIRARGETK